MPTLRLEFELDSEVYPELHAALSLLKSNRARAERMRQLAAAGLVWEKVRLHGSAAVVEPLPSPVPPPAPLRRSRPSREDVEQVMRELPVLVDVVDSVGPASMASLVDEDDDDTEMPEAPLHVPALSHKPASRSRLMRMKERGLFKNG